MKAEAPSGLTAGLAGLAAALLALAVFVYDTRRVALRADEGCELLEGGVPAAALAELQARVARQDATIAELS